MDRRGRFITIEGGEGTGKTTQARSLVDALRERGLEVLLTREPGGAPGAEMLRELLLYGGIDWPVTAEVLLHFAARAEHVERTIRPALAAGVWVVCDRFVDSTMAYQGYGLGADRGMIADLAALMGLVPDVTIVLDVSPDIAAQRLRGRLRPADRYEQMDAALHARVREGFRAIAQAEPQRCVLVEADGPEAEVAKAVLKALQVR